MIDAFSWQFPDCSNRCDSIEDEILRTHLEVNEAFFALVKESPERALQELEDVKHNAETAQRMILAEHGLDVSAIWKAKSSVIEGNRQRGYYD